ncbi:MAG: retropepsin-like aspartic protease [Desulfuromonadaceae bacterium]|nr:retropepsin-like aspartic protease [Desulfuromonadaceae bacterium]
MIYWLDDKSKIPPPIPEHYKYLDKNGIIFWVDDYNKIPEEYRKQTTRKNDDLDKSKDNSKMKSAPQAVPGEKIKYSTKISIVNNVILIPVVFRNKGQRVDAKMILDTGASVTTIYSALASKLHLNKNKLTRVKSINANGVPSDTLLTKVDHMEVGDKILSNPEVVVMPLLGSIGVDGLLGNSFLRYFNFTIDYPNQLLIWN